MTAAPPPPKAGRRVYRIFVDPEYDADLAAKLRESIGRCIRNAGYEPEFVEDSALADIRLDASMVPGQRYKKAAEHGDGPTYALSFPGERRDRMGGRGEEERGAAGNDV